MSAPTSRPVVFVDIEGFKLVNAAKIATATKQLTESTITRDELANFVSLMDKGVTRLCWLIAIVIKMEPGDISTLSPSEDELMRSLNTFWKTPKKITHVLFKYAMEFSSTYMISSLYSTTDEQMQVAMMELVCTCAILHGMEIKYAAYCGEVCSVCGAGCAPAFMCRECKNVQYCSKRCRQIGWKDGHATECKKE